MITNLDARSDIARAESETKMKQEKVSEIKRLNAGIASIRSEMSKYEEMLEDCKRYKEFLDKLTPEEWKKEQIEGRQRRKEERRRRLEAELAAAAAAAAAAEEAERQREVARKEKEAKEKPAGKGLGVSPQCMTTAGKDSKDSKAAEAMKPPEPPKAEKPKVEVPDEEEDDVTSAMLSLIPQDLPMYFSRPQQLLDIFAAFEERNLFLIQNSQETEEALEELKQKLEETKRKMCVHTNWPSNR